MELGRIGVASKGYGAALREDEVALDNVLDGEFIHSVVDRIVAKEVQSSLIIIGGTQFSVTVERNIVARCLVHDKL